MVDKNLSYAQASEDFRFAASVASFSMLLRHSRYRGNASYSSVLELAEESRGDDSKGYRRGLCDLVQRAGQLAGEFK